MLIHAENPDLRQDLDAFQGDGFPTDAYSARALIERYPLRDVVADRIAAKAALETAADTEVRRNTDKRGTLAEITEERFSHIRTLQTVLSDMDIDFEAELRDAGIDPHAPEEVEALLRFLDVNAARYLAAAQARSP